MEKILEIKNLTKKFPGVLALDRVNLNVYRGRAMGLVGENGAGKSTIIKTIGGIHKQEKGQIYFNSKLTNFKNISSSKSAGIAIVYQELQLAENLSILENLFLGREIRNKAKMFAWSKMRSKTVEILKKLNLNLKPNTLIQNLSMGNKQMIEIARALLFNAKLILFDEPTSSLSGAETKTLFEVIKRLKEDGISIIYVSHRMEELPIVCDDITIFRDGKSILEKPMNSITDKEIVSSMIGRDIKDQFVREKPNKGSKIISFKNIKNKFVNDVSFDVYEGEVLGFFGLIGAGRTELFKSIIGLYEYQGQVDFLGKNIKFKNPQSAIKKGLYYLTEDRKDEGLILEFNIKKNTSASSLSTLLYNKYFRIINSNLESKLTTKINERLKTRMSSMKQKVLNLSGGNQQKVAIAKSLMTMPKIFILDEPTRGIDVGAKQEIYKIISELKKSNVCIIFISSDLPEVLGISDRLIVMNEGDKVAEHDARATNSEEIMNEILFYKNKNTLEEKKGRKNE